MGTSRPLGWLAGNVRAPKAGSVQARPICTPYGGRPAIDSYAITLRIFVRKLTALAEPFLRQQEDDRWLFDYVLPAKPDSHEGWMGMCEEDDPWSS